VYRVTLPAKMFKKGGGKRPLFDERRKWLFRKGGSFERKGQREATLGEAEITAKIRAQGAIQGPAAKIASQYPCSGYFQRK